MSVYMHVNAYTDLAEVSLSIPVGIASVERNKTGIVLESKT